MTKYKDYLTTGEAAAIFCVDPDTVLRWIKSGDIPAIRTPGGHYRIHRDVFLSKMIEENKLDEKEHPRSAIPYCWEFYSESGKIQTECKHCIVYQSRTSRCYELSKIPAQIGHAKLYCTNTCQECHYFKNFSEVTV